MKVKEIRPAIAKATCDELTIQPGKSWFFALAFHYTVSVELTQTPKAPGKNSIIIASVKCAERLARIKGFGLLCDIVDQISNEDIRRFGVHLQRILFIGTVVVELFLLSTFFRASAWPIRLDLQTQGTSAPSSLPADQVSRLIAVLRDEKLRQIEPARVKDALAQLGAAKSIVAIPDIIRLLTFRLTDRGEKPRGRVIADGLVTPSDQYPAIGALREIGEPCLPALVQVIETHNSNSLESQNVQYLIIGMFRDKLKEGGAYLTIAASDSKTQLGSQRLTIAAEQIYALATTIENNQKHD